MFSIQRMTQNDLEEYYQRLLAPDNMVLTVVGDIDAKELVQAVQEGFGDLKKGFFSTPAVPQESPLARTTMAEIYKPKEQAHFVFGFLGTSLSSQESQRPGGLGCGLIGSGRKVIFRAEG